MLHATDTVADRFAAARAKLPADIEPGEPWDGGPIAEPFQFQPVIRADTLWKAFVLFTATVTIICGTFLAFAP